MMYIKLSTFFLTCSLIDQNTENDFIYVLSSLQIFYAIP